MLMRILYIVYKHVVEQQCSALLFFFFQAEDGIQDLVRSRGLGDVSKREEHNHGSSRMIRHDATA